LKTVFSASPRTKRLRPPDLYEYSIDNFWFKAAGLEDQKINEPLRGSHTADVVIIGGGYTGLSSAYNIQRKFPEKKIVLLEGACCGYGASGRNGGFCVATSLIDKRCKDTDARNISSRLSTEVVLSVTQKQTVVYFFLLELEVDMCLFQGKISPFRLDQHLGPLFESLCLLWPGYIASGIRNSLSSTG